MWFRQFPKPLFHPCCFGVVQKIETIAGVLLRFGM